MHDSADGDGGHRVTGHAARDHREPKPAIRLGAIAGAIAVLAAAVVGIVALARQHGAPAATDATVNPITITESPTVPLSAPQILGLLSQQPDFGGLTDLQRRKACLSGLGLPPSAPVLGAQPLDVAGAQAVVLVVPGDSDDVVEALLVRPACNAADTGLMAATRVPRP